jgi:hypothetical protein
MKTRFFANLQLAIAGCYCHNSLIIIGLVVFLWQCQPKKETATKTTRQRDTSIIKASNIKKAENEDVFTYDYLDIDFENKNFKCDNLQLYLVKAKQNLQNKNQKMGNYTPLKKALQQKSIIISEGEREQVNQLLIENTSKDTIYIMAGEIVQGGKQDRVIAQDVLLAPNQGKTAISVFCVEQGRWEYKEQQGEKFESYYGLSSTQLRKSVEKSKNQGSVWNEVSRSNQKLAVNSTTGAYTAQRNSSQFQEKQKNCLNSFIKDLKNHKNLVGIVAVTGNRIIGCDIFASPKLLQNNLENILSSYIKEAITDGEEVKINQKEVKKYMDDIMDKSAKKAKIIQEKGKVFSKDKKQLHLSTFE